MNNNTDNKIIENNENKDTLIKKSEKTDIKIEYEYEYGFKESFKDTVTIAKTNIILKVIRIIGIVLFIMYVIPFLPVTLIFKSGSERNDLLLAVLYIFLFSLAMFFISYILVSISFIIRFPIEKIMHKDKKPPQKQKFIIEFSDKIYFKSTKPQFIFEYSDISKIYKLKRSFLVVFRYHIRKYKVVLHNKYFVNEGYGNFENYMRNECKNAEWQIKNKIF